jgi:hypothetical protein
MFLRYFSRGFAAGLGFAVGFLLLTTLLPTLLMHRIRIDIPSTSTTFPTSPSSTTVEAPATAPPPQPYSLHAGKQPKMTIPERGGIAFIAILQDGVKTGRPSTAQYWLTADQLWRIDTKGDMPEFQKLDYPLADPVETVEKRLREEYFAETGMTSTVDRADLSRIDRGIADPSLNGVQKRNADGVVWFLPNPR